MSNIKEKYKKSDGYTIIETMISVALFVVVVVYGMTSLLGANLASKKSQNMRSIMDGLNFMMEDMSRNMRTGYNYHCFTAGESISGDDPDPEVSNPKSCASGWAISFEFGTGDPSNHNDQWVYKIENDSNGKGAIWVSTVGPYNNNSFARLSPSEVVIDVANSQFSILGAEPPSGNKQQPLVLIRLSGTVTYKNVVTPFSLQTSVSQRLIDI